MLFDNFVHEVAQPVNAPITVAVSSSEPVTSSHNYSFSSCTNVGHQDVAEAGSASIFPASDLEHFYISKLGKSIDFRKAVVTLLHGPKHGKLFSSSNGIFGYLPNKGFIGQDKAVFLVELGNRKYIAGVTLAVREVVDESFPACERELHFEPAVVNAE